MQPNDEFIDNESSYQTRWDIPADVCDIIRAGSMEDLQAYLPALMPDGYVDRYRYNLLKRMPEIRKGNRFVPVTDVDFNNFYFKIDDTFKKNGLGRSLSLVKTRMLFDNICDERKIDPFYEHIKNIKWDGIPRVRRWFIEGLGAHLMNYPDELSDKVVEEVTQAWFVAGIKRSMHQKKFENVPVLISKTQGVGKTTFVKYTALAAVDESWYNSTTVDVNNPKLFFERIMGAKVIEWGEAQQFKKRENADIIKEFISAQVDTYREAYARMPKIYFRRWIPIVTSNEFELFSDPSGNRRFFPFICDESRITKPITEESMFSDEAIYEVEQAWAEAFEMEKNGARAFVSKEIEQLAATAQKNSSRDNDFYEAIFQVIDTDERYESLNSFISSNDVLNIAQSLSYKFPGQIIYIRANSIMRYHDDEWEYFPNGHTYVTGSDGKKRRLTAKGFKRIKLSPRVDHEDKLLQWE